MSNVIQPDFTRRRTFDPNTETAHDVEAWKHECVAAAQAEGCTWPRWTFNPANPDEWVFTAWKQRPVTPDVEAIPDFTDQPG